MGLRIWMWTYHDLVDLAPRRAELCLELIPFRRQTLEFLFMFAKLLSVMSSHFNQHRETHRQAYSLGINSDISRAK